MSHYVLNVEVNDATLFQWVKQVFVTQEYKEHLYKNNPQDTHRQANVEVIHTLIMLILIFIIH